MAKFASPELANDIASYIDEFQGTVRKLAIEAYKKSEQSDITIYKLLKDQETGENLPGKKKLTLNDLNEDQKIKYFDIYGKIYDLSTTAIKVCNDQVVKEYEKQFEKATGKKTGSSADNLEYTLTKIMENETHSIQEKVALMAKAYVSIMVTGHPTDPTSIPHKIGLSNVEKFMFNNIDKDNPHRSDFQALKSVLTDYFSVSVTEGKKTQKLEAEEGNIFFENIYYGLKNFNRRFNGLAEKFNFKEELEKIQPIVEKQFMALTKWLGGGDGDGNDNSTRESLKEGLESGRATATKLYLKELDALQKLITKVSENSESIETIKALKADISANKFTSKKEMLNGIEKVIDNIYEDPNITKSKKIVGRIVEEANLLKSGMNTFGLYCGTTDLRHESETIQWTVAKISQQAKDNALAKGDHKSAEKFLTFEQYMELPPQSSEGPSKNKYIKQILRSPGLSEQVQAVDYDVLQKKDANGDWDKNDKEGFQARRILGREKLVAEHKGSSRNFVISEAKSSADYLAVEFLKKASKFEGEQNPVLLVESFEDIRKLPGIIRNLLKDPYSAKQIRDGKLVVMIADSDNRRRAGFDVDYFIDFAKQALFNIAEKNNINLEIVDGGGPDGSRGGQYEATKKPLHHGYNASRAGVSTMGVTGQTIQGRQNNNHFLSPQSAERFTEALYSQVLYALSALKGIIPNPRLTSQEKDDQQLAWAIHRKYSLTGVKDFKTNQENKPFKNLYDEGPWLSNKVSNNSSRPDKRGGQISNVDGNMTIGQFLGEPYYILDARAISGATFFRHSGILPELMIHDEHAQNTLLQTQKKHGQPADFTYKNSKQTREHFRELAKSLYRCDYDTAWISFTGKIPSAEEKAQYLKEFNPKSNNNNVASSLAAHENKALEIAKNVYEIILGREPDLSKGFDLKSTFARIWPAQAKQLDILEANSKEAKHYIAQENYYFNTHRDQPITPSILKRIEAVSKAVASLADENTIPQAGIIAAANLNKKVDNVGLDRPESTLVINNLNLQIPKFLEFAAKQFGLSFNHK